MKKIITVVAIVGFAFAGLASAKTRVACIGDSITYGYTLPDREHEAYPVQLQKLLDEKFPGKYEVRNFGNSGRGIYLDSMRGTRSAASATCQSTRPHSSGSPRS